MAIINLHYVQSQLAEAIALLKAGTDYDRRHVVGILEDLLEDVKTSKH
jgi:hypothetical protein